MKPSKNETLRTALISIRVNTRDSRGRNVVEEAKQSSWGDEKNVNLADSSSTTSVVLGDQK